MYVEVSKHGLRISSASDGLVKLRVPLLELVAITTFFDGFGKTNIVFIEKRATQVYYLHLMQMVHNSSTAFLCKQLKDVFVQAEEFSKLIEVIEPPSPSLTT